ncbi:MAG: DUF1569 domain-containing protein [Phycisphaerales bacterium]
MRRELILKDLDEAVKECRRLFESGYEAKGNWSLGQICNHIRLTMESNMRGYPKWMSVLGYPLRPVFRKLALPRLLAGRSINGVRTAGTFVPIDGLDDASELQLFEQCVEDFMNSNEELHAHPGFGRMSRDQFNTFHAAHTAHHLSFLHD